jgi:phage recombination protein Bet
VATTQQPAPKSPPAQAPPKAADERPARDKALLDGILDRQVSYTPFLAKDPITLSARLVMAHLCRPTRSGKLCTESQAVRFIMLCKSRGLNPWEGDAFIVGYDGKDGPEFNLVTAHQAFLKRAEVHPEYDGMSSGVVVRRKGGQAAGELVEVEGDLVDDGEVLAGGWARVKFKTRSVPVYRRLKLATFNKGQSRWAADPAGMIVKCAEADALRSAFPNSLGGMYLDDELPAAEEAAAPPRPEPLPAGRSSLRRPAPPAPKPAAKAEEPPPSEAPPEDWGDPELTPEERAGMGLPPADGALFGDGNTFAGPHADRS